MKDEEKNRSQLIDEIREMRKQVAALTRPLPEMEGICFEDLFNLSDIQHLQDLYADAFGVAALITRPDGTPITQPSNFTDLCSRFVRKTEQGKRNCMLSDAAIGRHNPAGPIVQPCLSAGLWDAGASITVGGRHIANWLIGQVRNETQKEEQIMAYARDLDLDETQFYSAYLRVPQMSRERFESVAQVIFFAANQLSRSAYQNLQQARFIAEKARTEASLRLTQFCVDHANMGIFQIRMDGTIRSANPYAAKMLGYTTEELCLLSIPDIDLSVGSDTLTEDMSRLSNFGRIRTFETIYIRKNSSQIPVEVTSNILEYETERYYIAFVQNISERKQSDKALRENQALLTNILESMDESVRVYDQRYAYLLVNKKFEETGGRSRQEVIGKTPWQIFPHLKTTAHEHNMQKAMAGQTVTGIEIRISDPGETDIWVKESYSPLRDADGCVIGIVGVGSDISRQRQDAEELRRLRNYLSNIIDSMPSILVGVDSAGKVTQWNHQAEHVTGICFEKACSQPLEKVFPGLIQEMDRIKVAIRESRVLRSSKKPRQDLDETRYEDITIFPLVANGVEGAVIRVDDVTEQVRMEEMMIQSEKMLSVGGLAAGMAHEINNPLAGMTQTAQVMAQRLTANFDIPASRKAARDAGTSLEAIGRFMEARGIPRMLQAIIESGHRVSQIVSNMLSFARKDSLTVSSHDLNEILDKTIELAATDYDLKKNYDFKRIQIIRKYDEKLPVVPCQASKIQQVILNILANGAQAMQEAEIPDSRFIIRTYMDLSRDMACLEIADNGPGMDEKTRKHIFDPFFTTKPAGVGTGLGLSVSYFIVTENHNGEMAVESSPGKGARFIIRLPRNGRE